MLYNDYIATQKNLSALKKMSIIIYIPCCPETRKKWGEKSKNRDYNSRNEMIRSKFIGGQTISNLAEEFFLSIESIKKIVYIKNL